MRRLTPLLCGLLIAAACTGADSESTTTGEPTTSTTGLGTTTTMSGATSTTLAETTTTTTPTTTRTLPEDVDPEVAARLAEQIDELVAITEEIRGLPFIHPPVVTFLSAQGLADRVREIIDEDLDPDDLAVQETWLTLLGLMDPGTDLESLYLDLYAEQVLGFYDGETGELTVAAESPELTVISKVALVHELVHALTDQHFAFHEVLETAFDEEEFDTAVALQSLVEGDATYFQFVYSQTELTVFELLDLAAETFTADTAIFDAAPRFLQEQLRFPYDQGFVFVDHLVSVGGIAGVDEAYQSPPETSHEVIHPERFIAGRGGRTVELPAAELEGWTVHEESTLGEFGLMQLFSSLFDDGLRSQLAAGWEHDRYRIYRRNGDVSFILLLQMEGEEDAIELAQALLTLARDQMSAGEGVDRAGGVEYPGSPYAFVDRVGDRLVFIAATDPDAGTDLRLLIGAGS